MADVSLAVADDFRGVSDSCEPGDADGQEHGICDPHFHGVPPVFHNEPFSASFALEAVTSIT